LAYKTHAPKGITFSDPTESNNWTRNKSLFHQYAQDEISKLMDISLRFIQLEFSRDDDFLLHPKIHIGYTTSGWATQLVRNFMGMHNLCIECARRWQPRTQCIHDKMIMSLFLNKARHIRLPCYVTS
jgi:hypothetical protein